MSANIKVLKATRLSWSTGMSGIQSRLYYPQSTGQSAIVKAMRFSNITSVTLMVNIYFVPSTATWTSGVPSAKFRIAPKDLTLLAGQTFSDQTELTLATNESIYVDILG